MLRYSMLVLAVFIVSSCAGTGGKQLGLDHTSNDPAAAVENLGKPAGVDASLWYELRQALTVELERFGAHRRVASAPVSELNKVADLAVALEGNQARFSWTYRNIGDYDVNGEVNIGDLTPIGLHFHLKQSDAEWEAARVADGDSNGEVNISDITPIAAHFKNTVTGYQLETSEAPEGSSWEKLAETPLAAASDTSVFPAFEYILGNPVDRNWYRIRPYYDTGEECLPGVPSDPVQVVINVNAPPDAPAGLKASDAAYTDRVVLNWIAPGAAEGFRIYRDSQLSWIAEIGDQNSWDDMTLTDTAPHTYWVTAFNSYGESDFSKPDAGSLKFSGGSQGRGDWWMYAHDPQHTGRSPYSVPDQPPLLWAFEADGGFNSVAFGDDGTVYASCEDDKIYALNPDATVRWITDLGATTYSPVAIGPDGTIYVGRESYASDERSFFALNPDGSIRWEIESEEGGSICACPLVAPGGRIFVGDNIGRFFAFSTSGAELARFEIPGLTFKSFYSSPALGPDGTVYVGCTDGNLYAFDFWLNVKWKFPTTFFVEASPAVGPDGTVYIGGRDGVFYAVNPDGSERWSYELDGAIYGAPAIATDGTVYFGYYGYAASALHAFAPEGSLKWTCETEDVETALAIDGTGTIFLADQDEVLHAIGPDGTVKWTYELSRYNASAVSIDEQGRLYVGSGRKLYCFGEGSMPPPPMAPTGVTASDGEFPGYVEVTWQKVPGATRYRIYRDSCGDENHRPWPQATVWDIDRWLDENLLQQEDWGVHTYWVMATNPYGESDPSEPETGYLGRLPADPGPGDWNIYGREPRHQRRSPAVGPQAAKIKWSKRVTADGSTYSFSEPVIGSEGRIYLATYDGWLVVINPGGTYHWKLDLGVSQCGSVAVGNDGIIYVGSSDGKLFALTPLGEISWLYQIESDVWLGGEITLADDGTIYASSSDGHLYCLAPDGSLNWRFLTGGEVSGAAAIGGDGTIYFASDDENLYAVDPNGVEQWRYGPIFGYPYIAVGPGGGIYIKGGGFVTALNSDGDEEWEIWIDNVQHGAPAIAADGTICLGWGDSTLRALSADGVEKWSYPAAGIPTSPVIDADGSIYFMASEFNQVYALDSEGNEKWTHKFMFESLFPGSPILADDGTLLVLCGFHTLYAFGYWD